MVVKLFLPERDVFELSRGQPVRLLPEALVESAPISEISFAGRVRDISPVVDPKTGTVKVTVAVVDRTAAVRPGAFVRAQIETDRRDEAVLVPKLAVVREGSEDFVFVASGDRAERRPVLLGYTRDGAVEIVEGLAPDEDVIVAGQTTLEDGALIDVIESPR